MTHAGRVVGWIKASVALVLTLAPTSALAQTEPLEQPKYIAVTRPTDNPAPLRCFAGQIWYPVVYLNEGQILQADAVREDWYRVAYPKGVPAAVTASEARYDAPTNSVTLTDDSTLQARNVTMPTSVESYKEIFDPKLPAGTVLSVLGEMRDSGQLTGYFVLPPDGATGWVNRRHVRDATPAEIRAFLASMNETPAQTTPPATTPEPRTTAPTTTTPPPAEHTPADDQPADDENTEQTHSPSQTTPTEAAPALAMPDSTTAETDADENEPTNDESDDAEMTPEQRRAALYARLSELDKAYEAVSVQNTEGAEITPLRAEYIALSDEAKAIPDDAAMARMAEYAAAKVLLLDLRAEVQDVQAQLAELEEKSSANQTAIDDTRRQIMRARGYAMVGVLTRSSLYTGGELPLRYRLQSSSSAIARTIAYIEAPEGRDLTPLLGKQVGVIVGADGATRSGPVPVLRAELVEEIPAPTGN